MIDSEKEMLEQIRLGNKAAYDAFYKQHFKLLYTLAFSYLKRHEIAEEIVHDVFVNFRNKAEKISITQSFKSYILRSVANAAINYIRKERADAGKYQEYKKWSLVEILTPEELEKRELLLVRIEKALEQLPPQCKKVMMMSRFEKLKQQDIADRLNISVKTVKNHLTFGFAKLRSILAAEGNY